MVVLEGTLLTHPAPRPVPAAHSCPIPTGGAGKEGMASSQFIEEFRLCLCVQSPLSQP